MVRRAESSLLFAVLISADVQSADSIHPAWDLAAGAGVRAGETRACTLLRCLTLSLPPSISRCCCGAVGRKSLPAPAAPLRRSLGTPALLSRLLSVFPPGQDRHLPLPGPFVPPRPHPPLGKASPASDASSCQPPKPRVPQPMCSSRTSREPPAAASLSRLFTNWRIRDVPLLLTPGVTDIYSQPVPVAAGKQRAPDGAGEFGFGRSPARAPATRQPSQFRPVFACERSVTNPIYTGISSPGHAMLFPAFASTPHSYCWVESPVKSIWVAGPWFAVKGEAEQDGDLRAVLERRG